MKPPFVFVNMAITADGKIATANRAVSSFGSKNDFEHLLELRATADAVMSGARTVNSEGVSLGPGPARFRRLRLERDLADYNLRVVVSGSGSINPHARIFHDRCSPIIILTTARTGERRLKRLRSVADDVQICGEVEIDFNRAANWLREKWHVKRLLCEGGAELNDALFRAGLVKELNVTICPKVSGGRNAPTIADGKEELELGDATRLKLKSLKRVSNELFLVYGVLKFARRG